MKIGQTRTRTQRHRTVLFALCLFLFAQWSLAAHACPLYKLAVPQSDAPMALMMAGGACEHQEQQPDPTCQKHCEVDRQIPPAVALDFVLPLSTTPILHIPVALHHTRPVPHPVERHSTAPPLNILYCVSLT